MPARFFLPLLVCRTLAQVVANDASHIASDACDVEAGAAAVVMLQQQLSLQPSLKSSSTVAARALQAPSQEQQLQDALPLIFLHIPKTGTSFLNAMLALPGVCTSPVVIDDAEEAMDDWTETLSQHCPGFNSSWNLQGHALHQASLPEASGHVMSMFRQPEQRLISFHRWMRSHHELLISEDIMEFWPAQRGRMVYQLAVPWAENDAWNFRAVGENEFVLEAVRVVEEDMVFVGVTEQWDLSICLLHAMFGGPCTRPEFMDVRPGVDPETGEVHETGSEYDVSVLQGKVDTEDRILYDAVLRIFERNLEEYDVTAESCEQGCWAEAGILES